MPSLLRGVIAFCVVSTVVGFGNEGISIGESEGSAVAKCVGAANTPGSRRIPQPIILSSHAVKTPMAIQVTGRLNLIDGLKVSPRGGGGQYDDASWGIEPLSSCAGYDRYVEIVGGDMFCIRCCNFPRGTNLISADYDRNAPCFAGNDIAGCARVVPGNYGPGFSFTEQNALPTVAMNTRNRVSPYVFDGFTDPSAAAKALGGAEAVKAVEDVGREDMNVTVSEAVMVTVTVSVGSVKTATTTSMSGSGKSWVGLWVLGIFMAML
ncbi:hypothetical protein BC829DRAFT_388615 [Chytridium lagenaria]|nr:hypothetical protein BC829DRAFT_388615 [Chytridium lagenaria]